MKKLSVFLFAMLIGLTINGFCQTSTPADFFAGKWEITIMGTPDGDSKMITNLVRKDGKLTGELLDGTGAGKPAIPITSIEESEGKIDIAFSASGYDITLELNKVDDENLKGSMMSMFDAKAKRIKE
ncbi:MAG: hypothetical protein ABIN80_09500 [Dyadobacter sp.]|uniref:hypothetical protein n=1 Tax=Dyadobacter sp. TaxID=1914288 RepID=UPI0032653A8C